MNSSFASLIKDQRQITLSVLGDSLSYGYLVRAGYIHMLMERLAKDYPSNLFHMHNHGMCGDTAQDGLRRLGEALLHPPADIALVQFGINDCFVGISASEFLEAVRRIVRGYQTECPKGIVLLIPPPPVYPPQENLMLEPFRQAMHELAKTLSVVCAPIHDHWPMGESSPTQWLDDGIHPSEEGYRLMARAVYAALTSSIPDAQDATAQ
jgi:acyl-CoA thioesterase-1